MKPTNADLEWLTRCFPGLRHDATANNIVGEIAFCAAYDARTHQMRIGDNEAHRRLTSFLCDSYSLRIDLNSIDGNGWPRVYEVGGRHQAISTKHNIDVIDLHIYPDSSCCLGIRFSPERFLKVERLLDELIIPFLYRLSYVDRKGLLGARRDLWGEYPHGDEGVRVYKGEMLDMANRDPGRNELCPCGSGRKFKRCHIDDVEAFRSALGRQPR